MGVLRLLGSKVLKFSSLDILFLLIVPFMQIFCLSEHLFRFLVDFRSKLYILSLFHILLLLLLKHLLISFSLKSIGSFNLIPGQFRSHFSWLWRYLGRLSTFLHLYLISLSSLLFKPRLKLLFPYHQPFFNRQPWWLYLSRRIQILIKLSFLLSLDFI